MGEQDAPQLAVAEQVVELGSRHIDREHDQCPNLDRSEAIPGKGRDHVRQEGFHRVVLDQAEPDKMLDQPGDEHGDPVHRGLEQDRLDQRRAVVAAEERTSRRRPARTLPTTSAAAVASRKPAPAWTGVLRRGADWSSGTTRLNPTKKKIVGGKDPAASSCRNQAPARRPSPAGGSARAAEMAGLGALRITLNRRAAHNLPGHAAAQSALNSTTGNCTRLRLCWCNRPGQSRRVKVARVNKATGQNVVQP